MTTNLSCGIVGLPNIGKSTLFNALTKMMIAANNFPFCTIEPNTGVVDVPDSNIKILSELSASKKLVYASMQFTDIAGLVKGASEGEGLGNKFLSNIRETDLIIHVVRCFDDVNVTHVDGRVDPNVDAQTINTELILADIQMAENARDKLFKKHRAMKDKPASLAILDKIIAHLVEEKPVRTMDLSKEELEEIKIFPFLTLKPMIYVANIGEEDIEKGANDYTEMLLKYATENNCEMVCISAKIEQELAGLSDEDASEILDSYGIKEKGLNRLIQTAFTGLGLITYYTTGEVETRAWTIPKGFKAPEAAGKIHTDLQKGFIRAEVISYEDMLKYKNRVKAKEAGVAKMEGKDYIVKDDDVILFYTN
ncbi:MAG: Ribosome-binding ATPase YchF [Chlamydiia bacterium]|nr:Ribosome-binding ATPase YchF [Chlamydiia bacterium]MCH9618707.1 Ribosome-binding ATPase YchF [Chlamydiia bacterium]MCH9624387.1 Ribosome-binding ATPase YchF [Chlamydiia bacterium]